MSQDPYQKIAEHLQLHYHDGDSTEIQELLWKILSADTDGTKELQGDNLQRLAEEVDEHLSATEPANFEHGAALGRYRDFEVLVAAGRYVPYVCVMLPNPLPVQLHLYPEYFSSRVARFLFGMQDLVIGNPELDPLVIVKSA